jgi:beta-lactamase superfamily II metal-dependent hydrolase
VLLGTFYNTKILLLSDLGRQGQSALLEHTNDLHANIIVTGLPTEGESLCDALIKAVQPEIIIVADSGYYSNRRASRILKERIEQSKIPVIYTRDSGAVKIVTTKGGWRLETMDGQKFNSAVSSEQLKRDAPVE